MINNSDQEIILGENDRVKTTLQVFRDPNLFVIIKVEMKKVNKIKSVVLTNNETRRLLNILKKFYE